MATQVFYFSCFPVYGMSTNAFALDKQDPDDFHSNVADYFMEIGLPKDLSSHAEVETSRQPPVKYPITAIACMPFLVCILSTNQNCSNCFYRHLICRLLLDMSVLTKASEFRS